ncbi:hypothetical protein YC2023_049865 [Brassica napus]
MAIKKTAQHKNDFSIDANIALIFLQTQDAIKQNGVFATYVSVAAASLHNHAVPLRGVRPSAVNKIPRSPLLPFNPRLQSI